jgi:hypothetical protein
VKSEFAKSDRKTGRLLGAADGPISKAIQEAAGANAIACVTNTGWQTGDTFLEWLRRNLRNVPNACIVLDLFSAHRFDKTTVSHEVFFFNPGTSECDPS